MKSLFCFFISFTDCLKLIVCDILLSCVRCCYFTGSMFTCNPVQLSLELIKGNLLTYY